jgi:REP element-mobilizing transposase RayT
MESWQGRSGLNLRERFITSWPAATRGKSSAPTTGDRPRWRATLSEACGRTGWRIHAWGLMSNHCHLLLETPEANLVSGAG